MDQPDRMPPIRQRKEAEPQFTQPFRQLIVMLAALGLVGFGGFVALPQVMPVFLANVYLNVFIAIVFLFGLIACFWQVWQVTASVSWIEAFVADDGTHNPDRTPRLLAALAKLLQARGARLQIGSASSRSIQDSVATRIDEARDITRYIVNLLIFLGLLGTFFGLATTVPAVVDTIRSLAPSEGEGGVEVFNRLMTGLEQQLGGMGTAFSSSLLGLAGSLVVGLMELFASHGQNRFYRELEEWLSTITKLTLASGDSDGTDSAAIGYLAEMAEQVEAMQGMFAQTDVNRAMLDQRLGELIGSVETLTTKMGTDTQQQEVLHRLADGQERMIAALEKTPENASGADAESRMRLRSIDVQLLRLLEEMQAGRQESLSGVRQDIAILIHEIRIASGRERV